MLCPYSEVSFYCAPSSPLLRVNPSGPSCLAKPTYQSLCPCCGKDCSEGSILAFFPQITKIGGNLLF